MTIDLWIPELPSQAGTKDHWNSLVGQLPTDRTTVRMFYEPPPLKSFHSRSIFLLTSPYEEHYTDAQLEFMTSVESAYFGYGLPGICDWRYGEKQLPIFRRLTYLCAPSPNEVAEFVQEGVNPKNVRWLGDPLSYDLVGVNTKRNPNRKTTNLLWAPHWSRYWTDGSPGFSNWTESIIDLETVLSLSRDIQVRIRPHPFLPFHKNILPEYASNLWPVEQFPKAYDALESLLSNSNVQLSDWTMIEDLTWSSHVLTDGISLIGYAMMAGCVTAVVRRADSPPLGMSGHKLISGCNILAPGNQSINWMTDNLITTDLQAVEYPTISQLTALEVYPLHEKSPGKLLIEWCEESAN